jgi:hypothetical protein
MQAFASRESGSFRGRQFPFQPEILPREVPEEGPGIRLVGGDAEAVAQDQYIACTIKYCEDCGETGVRWENDGQGSRAQSRIAPAVILWPTNLRRAVLR